MISCPKCKATNQDAAKFCLECGEKLTASMGSKVAGAAADQAKKFGDHAKRTAQSEINSSVTRIINDTIREIGKKIFGK